MPAYNSGVQTPYQVSGYSVTEIFGIAINWFAPRSPLLYRLAKRPFAGPHYQIVVPAYRPRSTTLGAAVTDTTGTSHTLADGSFIMEGDVLEYASGERVEVTAVSGNTITVRRGIEGTTAATQSNSTTVKLIGNSAPGYGKHTAISSQKTTIDQYMQTFQHNFSVGGGVQTNGELALSPGAATPLDEAEMLAMQNCVDDIEYSSYFGKSEALSGGVANQKMAGVKHIMATNVVTDPSDAAAYKATSFQRDLLTAPRKKGGQPNVVFVASNWMDAFSTWGQPLQLIQAQDSVFGRDITTYRAPFLGDVEIVEASLLPDFTAFSLTEEEALFRVKRPMVREYYAKTADQNDGHILAELSVELRNEAHHAWLEGVTAFSA